MKERVSDLTYPYFVRFGFLKKRFRCRIPEFTRLKRQETQVLGTIKIPEETKIRFIAWGKK